MRISTFQIYQRSVNTMLDQQAGLSKSQQQLSTGKAILAPSDDPAAASRVLKLGQLIETNQQHQRNADAAQTSLSLEDSVLSQVGDLLQRARELAVQGNNDILNASDRTDIAFEAKGILQQLLQVANSQDASGNYLFSGYQTSTKPFTDNGSGNFTYNGDQGQHFLQIGPSTKIAGGDTGKQLFTGIDDGAGGVSDMFSVVSDFVTSLESNTPTGTSISRLDSAIGTVLTQRASVGARLNSIDSQRTMNDSFNLELQRNRSKLEDLDYASAVSRFQRQTTALQASQQTFSKASQLSLFNYL